MYSNSCKLLCIFKFAMFHFITNFYTSKTVDGCQKLRDCLIQCYYFYLIRGICWMTLQQCIALTSVPLFFYRCPPFQWCSVFFCLLTPFGTCPSTKMAEHYQKSILVHRHCQDPRTDRPTYTVHGSPSLIHVHVALSCRHMAIPDSTKTDISFIFQNNSETKERALQVMGEYSVCPPPPTTGCL